MDQWVTSLPAFPDQFYMNIGIIERYMDQQYGNLITMTKYGYRKNVGKIWKKIVVHQCTGNQTASFVVSSGRDAKVLPDLKICIFS